MQGAVAHLASVDTVNVSPGSVVVLAQQVSVCTDKAGLQCAAAGSVDC